MKAGKVVLALVMVVLVLGVGGGVAWYLSVPHSAEEQFAYAQKLDKKLEGDSLTKGPKELAGDIERVVGEYRKVGGKYGKSAKAAEGLKRGAAIEEKIAKDEGKAMGLWDEVIKDYPGAEDAGEGLMEEARLLREDGDVLKEGKPGDAAGKYKEAISKLEAYRKRFEKDEKAGLDHALMEIGRIWQDGLGEPLIHSIEAFEKLIKDYPNSDDRAEAMWRLGKAFEQAKEFEKALAMYGQFIEEYPKSKWAAEAMMARGKILADQMDKHEEAAKEFEKLQKEHPESQLSGAAGGRARQEQGKAGSEEGTKYSKGRYGGTLPYDTVADKPIPPSGMMREFAEQKLDAQKYDLNVEFVPAENRITVEGTLKVVNGGEAKKRMLLMLGAPLEISALTVDGKAVKFTHQGETLEIMLGEEWKKGGEATVGFKYTGQYAEPVTDEAAFLRAMQEGAQGMPGVRPERGAGTMPGGKASGGVATAPGTQKAKALRFASSIHIGLGEYGYALSSAAWYPITIMGDVFEAHMVMKVPAGIEAVANGEAVRRGKSTKEGVEGEFEFNTKEPVFGLYFAYGPYVVEESQVGPIHYYTYFRPENAGKHGAYVEVTNRILSFYASKYAPFPYEKMAMVEVPLPPILGGVGPASLMFLQEKIVARKEVPENLLAHELAHQWFGNRVPINMQDDGYNQWLSEGFATYSDALYTEHTEGANAMAAHMERYGQLFFQFFMMAPKGHGAIKTTYPNDRYGLYRPVIYEKGAIVLHMLRKVMGDEKFFKLMRDYVETYKNQPTTVDDFERLAAKTYGDDLSWFFAEWIDQTVFAHWKLKVEVTGGEKAGESCRVKVMVSQPDDFVKMPVDITLLGSGGERQMVSNVMLDKKEQVVEATAPFKVVKVVLDEMNWVLKRPGSDNIWPAEKAAAAP